MEHSPLPEKAVWMYAAGIDIDAIQQRLGISINEEDLKKAVEKEPSIVRELIMVDAETTSKVLKMWTSGIHPLEIQSAFKPPLPLVSIRHVLKSRRIKPQRLALPARKPRPSR